MSYAVKELFLTLQGEGGQAGRAAVVCRFSGSNLWSGREEDRAAAACNFCDTDFVGVESGRDLDKFAACHLTPVRSELVDAPYVAETPLVLECRLLHTLEIGLHTLFVGEILDVKAEESVLGENGMADIEKVQPIIFDPARQSYFGIGRALGQAFDTTHDLELI